MNYYMVGQAVRLSAAFTDADGVAYDPPSVTVTTHDPAGTVSTHNYPGDVTRAGIGAFYVDVVGGVPGTWTYRVEAQDQAAAEGQFFINASEVAP